MNPKVLKQTGVNAAPIQPQQPEYITYDIETATMSQYQDDALDPLKGRIVCVGFKEWSTGKVLLFAEENEKAITLQAWSYILSKSPNAVFMGFNVVNFDFQWLIKKGLKYCPEKLHIAQYFNIPHADIRMVLGNGDKFAKGSLKDYCDFFGIPVKQLGTGLDVTAWFKAGEFEKIKAYNAEDLEAEEKLAALVLNLKKQEPTSEQEQQKEEPKA